MRIVQLITRRQRRGAEVFASQLSEGLAREGHEVRLVALFEPPAGALESATVPVSDLAGRATDRLSQRLVRDLAELLRRKQPEIVQANGSATLKYASLAKRWSGGEWPLIYRNISIASHWLRWPGQRSWGKWLLRQVDHVVAVSEASRADFRETYRLDSARISTIPIGVDIPATPAGDVTRDQLLRLAGLAEPVDILAHVGSFSPEKNHVWMVEAFAEVVRRRPSAHLLLFGDGPLRIQVAATANRCGVANSVHLLGSRSDVPMLLGGADLLLLPSLVEGIPGVILEAAAQAVPVVATAVGSIPEAVQDGETGILVRTGDKPGFVSALDRLIRNPGLRRQLGHAARTFVAEKYSLERIVAEFDQLYSRIAGVALAPEHCHSAGRSAARVERVAHPADDYRGAESPERERLSAYHASSQPHSA